MTLSNSALLQKNLRAVSDTSNKAVKFRTAEAEAAILLNRGLKQNAFELLSENLALARTMSNPVKEIQALDSFISYAQRTADPVLLQQYELQLKKSTRSFLNLMEVQSAFRELALFYTDNYPIRNQQTLARLNKIGKQKVMQRESNMDSPLAHIFYYNFYTYLNFWRGDFTDAFKFAKKRHDYVLNHKQQVNQYESYRLNSMELLIMCCIKLKKFSEAIAYFNELKELCTKAPDTRKLLLLHACFSSLNAAYQWKEATEKERQRSLIFFIQNKDYSPVISDSMINLAYACFRHKEYTHVLTLLNHIISDKYAFHHSVLQTEARVLGLLTHYELKNYLLIEYMVTNTKRFLRHEKKLFPLENAVMNGIRHLPDKINERDMLTALKKLKENLIQIRKNPFERNAMSSFDFVGWIEEKLLQ